MESSEGLIYLESSTKTRRAGLQTPKAVVMMTPRPSPKSTYESVLSAYGEEEDQDVPDGHGMRSPPLRRSEKPSGHSDERTEELWAMDVLELSAPAAPAAAVSPANSLCICYCQARRSLPATMASLAALSCVPSLAGRCAGTGALRTGSDEEAGEEDEEANHGTKWRHCLNAARRGGRLHHGVRQHCAAWRAICCTAWGNPCLGPLGLLVATGFSARLCLFKMSSGIPKQPSPRKGALEGLHSVPPWGTALSTAWCLRTQVTTRVAAPWVVGSLWAHPLWARACRRAAGRPPPLRPFLADPGADCSRTLLSASSALVCECNDSPGDVE